VLPKRKGVVAGRGLKETRSKHRECKNRIRGIWCGTSWPMTTKSISIKGTGCRFAGCVRKAVELTSGELGACLGGVSDTRLRDKRLSLIAQQKSAEA
jgi:hypothetical protein